MSKRSAKRKQLATRVHSRVSCSARASQDGISVGRNRDGVVVMYGRPDGQVCRALGAHWQHLDNAIEIARRLDWKPQLPKHPLQLLAEVAF